MDKNLQKHKILCDIRQKVLDLKSFYPNTPIEVSIHAAENVKTADRIKLKITESV